MVLLASTLLNGNDLAIPLLESPPDGVGATGEIVLQSGPNSRKNLWRWSGSQWLCIPLSPVVGSGDPNGIYDADGLGQFYYSQSDDSLWLWDGSLWKKISGGGSNNGGGSGGW